MSTEVATIDRVRAASAALRTEGKSVTADAIIANIGGGSKQTVLKHLKTLRSDPDSRPAVPPVIIDMALPMLAEIFQAGERAEAERHQSQSDRMGRMMDDLELQVDELAIENTRLLENIAVGQAHIEELDNKHAASLKELAAASSEIKRLQKELQRERDEGSKELSKLMEQLNARLSFIGHPAQ